MFNIIPWDRPSSLSARRERNPFSSLQSEVNRAFDDFFNNGFEQSLIPAAWTGNQMTPAVDIIENDKSFKVEVELPGMKEDDVEVTINDSYLTIRGEKKESKEDKSENYVRRERYYGSYQRTVALPETVNTDKAKATFKKGVLWVEIPKKAEAVKPSKKLDIKTAA
ncbi:MAG: Hsp20/alpha crystallin family protein [Rickettsiales bacterium]|nr:Hsp20/alpha crystallin family protein [Rickettsiales bacterium]